MGMAAIRFSSSAGVGFVAYGRVHRGLDRGWRKGISLLAAVQLGTACRSGPSHVVRNRGQARPAHRATLIEVTVVEDCALAVESWDERLLQRSKYCNWIQMGWTLVP